MAHLVLTYVDRDLLPMFAETICARIECEDMLAGLAILHERLNAVAMPRVHQSTAGKSSWEIAEGLRADDNIPTISC